MFVCCWVPAFGFGFGKLVGSGKKVFFFWSWGLWLAILSIGLCVVPGLLFGVL